MTTDPPGAFGPPLGEGVDDPVAARAACSARVLEREGVPVVLALVDRRPAAPGAPAGAAGAPQQDPGEGPALLALFDRYATAVAPGAADDDAAALYSVVELIGFTHVHPGPPPAGQAPVGRRP